MRRMTPTESLLLYLKHDAPETLGWEHGVSALVGPDPEKPDEAYEVRFDGSTKRWRIAKADAEGKLRLAGD